MHQDLADNAAFEVLDPRTERFPSTWPGPTAALSSGAKSDQILPAITNMATAATPEATSPSISFIGVAGIMMSVVIVWVLLFRCLCVLRDAPEGTPQHEVCCC
jgi:hypothetical protein